MDIIHTIFGILGFMVAIFIVVIFIQNTKGEEYHGSNINALEQNTKKEE